MTKQYIDRNALLKQAETMFDGQREVTAVKAEHIYSAAYIKDFPTYCPNCGAKMDGGKRE